MAGMGSVRESIFKAIRKHEPTPRAPVGATETAIVGKTTRKLVVRLSPVYKVEKGERVGILYYTAGGAHRYYPAGRGKMKREDGAMFRQRKDGLWELVVPKKKARRKPNPRK
jgi:hypothetical protein